MASPRVQIAIVDDDASVRKAIGRLFEPKKFGVNAYSSAAELLASLDKRKPDCLIVDFHMPNMNALELLGHLNHTGQFIPMIIVTAFDEAKNRENCMAAGACAYFSKPIRRNVLMDAVEKIIKH
jgi:FixJ family two-component response regulator